MTGVSLTKCNDSVMIWKPSRNVTNVTNATNRYDRIEVVNYLSSEKSSRHEFS